MASTSRKTATAAEALAASITFTHAGIDYTIEPASEWPFEAVEAFEEGKVATLLRAILGAEQYAAFKATRPKVSDASGLAEALQKAAGISGN